MLTVLSSAIVILAAPLATAECLSLSYEARGKVCGDAGGGLSGAVVTISWGRFGGQTDPIYLLTDGSGKYVLPFEFNPSSGHDGRGDLCNATLEQLTIEVSADGYADQRVVVTPVPQSVVQNFHLVRK